MRLLMILVVLNLSFADEAHPCENSLDQFNEGDVILGSLSPELQFAQTFSVGIDGTLAEVFVKLLVAAEVPVELELKILETEEGLPGSVERASVTVTLSNDGTFRWYAIDLGSSQVLVSQGEQLALVLTDATPSGLLPLGSIGDEYSEGDLFFKTAGDWELYDGHVFSFQTHICAEPVTIERNSWTNLKSHYR